MLESQIIDRTASPLGLFLTLMVAACGSDAETGADWVGTANGKLAPGAGITADDFHTGVMDTQLWEVVDPHGDGTC
jgi:hypothetical protein